LVILDKGLAWSLVGRFEPLKISIFPGCMVLARFQGYELASRIVLERLGYQIVDRGPFLCCGSSLLPGKTENWINFSAYNLALAEEAGVAIVTLCGNCTQNFKRANLLLRDDPALRHKTESALGRLGVAYGGGVKVFHILELLSERLDAVAKASTRKMGVRAALTHPCQVFRPKSITGTTDNPQKPQTMRRILDAMGVDIVDYPREYDCCGATSLLFDEDLGLGLGRAKLESARSHGANLTCAACGNCLYLMNRVQQRLPKSERKSAIPVLSITQLMAVAFGFSPKSLRLSRKEVLALG
jgi:heterodisulfide reductase subunit B